MKVSKGGLMDLHVHLDGSLTFSLAKKLAAGQGMEEKTDKELKELMTVPEDCRDLNGYLTKFDYSLSLMQTKEGVTESVCELLKIQESQGLIYSEIRFAPQLHRRMGLSQREVVRAAVRGLEKYWDVSGFDGMEANLILCCMRGADNWDENMETVSVAGEFLGKGVCALDLAGAEALFPTEDFEDIFKLAQKKDSLYHSCRRSRWAGKYMESSEIWGKTYRSRRPVSGRCGTCPVSCGEEDSFGAVSDK